MPKFIGCGPYGTFSPDPDDRRYNPLLTERITADAALILNDVYEIILPFDFPSGLLRYVHEPKRQASHKLTPLERHQQSQRDKRAMVKRSRQL